jgi:hypothetical protein
LEAASGGRGDAGGTGNQEGGGAQELRSTHNGRKPAVAEALLSTKWMKTGFINLKGGKEATEQEGE